MADCIYSRSPAYEHTSQSGKQYTQVYTDCRTVCLLDEALDSGDYKAVKDVRRAYEDELKSLNLDTKSETEEMTIGQRIEQYEEHDPIPKPDKELLDVDGVQKYITSNFLYPVKRMFGLATEEEEQQIYEHDGYGGSGKVIEEDE